MVVKTERCAFSEYWIFPGHGMKYVRKDGQPIILSGSKAKSLYLQKLKPSKLQWTQGWRRLNKKALVDTISKKRTRRNTKIARAIVGASLDDIKKLQSRKPAEKSAAREAALKEIKDRNKKAKAAKISKSGPSGGKAQASKQKGQKGAKLGSTGR
mmetsp:Transcript_66435/g.149985  ORF Transcript_66435/g.149985 Transcript_66435/m.149985 type:complete len:155 (-) Transcript_66435:406-870(-)|eukprot:CAMPEP_0172648958 /NCGR_PEP_ID=MMETSP1068-20121228/241544_1 /TAXON_ID=35684 /ORGANISM="Pseudopedinella elastica, Strain CCMP716" /LENGTH=154 /DNA_ID=CAMNT_0013463301 /DNA_START=548 /DNA_END=1012 /DNA_ORIENTATION=-